MDKVEKNPINQSINRPLTCAKFKLPNQSINQGRHYTKKCWTLNQSINRLNNWHFELTTRGAVAVKASRELWAAVSSPGVQSFTYDKISLEKNASKFFSSVGRKTKPRTTFCLCTVGAMLSKKLGSGATSAGGAAFCCSNDCRHASAADEARPGPVPGGLGSGATSPREVPSAWEYQAVSFVPCNFFRNLYYVLFLSILFTVTFLDNLWSRGIRRGRLVDGDARQGCWCLGGRR